MVGGDTLVDAQPSFQGNEPVVNFPFDGVGAKRFADVTRESVGHPFAIVLDNKVISAPVIREPITGGRGRISGNFTVASGTDLALLLRAGALPAPMTMVEERTVGPNSARIRSAPARRSRSASASVRHPVHDSVLRPVRLDREPGACSSTCS